MKKNLLNLICSTLLLCFGGNIQIANAQKIEFERVKKQCKKLAYEDRVRLTVVRFNVTAKEAQRQFGGELATMLTNALQEVNCFRILESSINLDDMTNEIEMGEMGYTTNASSAQSGQMLGAQAILTGEVTEFYEGQGKGGAFGLSIVKNKARIGFVLKVINPQTREVLWSKSIEAVGKKPGKFNGAQLFGVKIAGGSTENTAIGDAVERGIIKAVQLLAEEKDNIPFPKVDSGVDTPKNWNASNCPFLNTTDIPSIMILLPERHTNQYLPQPNGESAIINKFANSGFIVIDPSVYATVRKGARFEEAFKNPLKAASLASEFGADIIVIGQGVSQRVSNSSGRVVCRATVNARVIRVNNGQILMAHTADAGSNDLSETTAANAALRNAGAQLGDFFLNQFCTRNFPGLGGEFASKGVNGASGGGGVSLETTYLDISKTDFKKLKELTNLLEEAGIVKTVSRSSFKKSNAILEVEHEGSMDDLLDIISSNAAAICEVTGFEGSEIKIKMN